MTDFSADSIQYHESLQWIPWSVRMADAPCNGLLLRRMKVHLGIDIGSTTLTAVAIDLETQETVGAVTVPNEAETTTPEDRERGRSEWDFPSITGGAVKATRELVDSLEAASSCSLNTAAIGVTGQQQGLQLYDSRFDSVGPFIGWQDRRCGERLPVGGGDTYLDPIRKAFRAGGLRFSATGGPAYGWQVSGFRLPALPMSRY